MKASVQGLGLRIEDLGITETPRIDNLLEN